MKSGHAKAVKDFDSEALQLRRGWRVPLAFFGVTVQTDWVGMHFRM